MRREGVLYAEAVKRPAWKEAVTSFLEKRQPDFHKE
jgi:hypothetical protein